MNIPAVKKNAEAGNAEAQVAMGNILSSRFRQSEALSWYRSAAAQGNIDAEYHVGHMLLFGAWGASTNLVRSNPIEGLHWTFLAATNFQPDACHDMSLALRQGLGATVNPVAAYAWLILYSKKQVGALVELNEMALEMNTSEISRAENLAQSFCSRDWQIPDFKSAPATEFNLKLNGITFGQKNRLAVINGKSLSEGEADTVI